MSPPVTAWRNSQLPFKFPRACWMAGILDTFFGALLCPSLAWQMLQSDGALVTSITRSVIVPMTTTGWQSVVWWRAVACGYNESVCIADCLFHMNARSIVTFTESFYEYSLVVWIPKEHSTVALIWSAMSMSADVCFAVRFLCSSDFVEGGPG